jgi:hypothetical protein
MTGWSTPIDDKDAGEVLRWYEGLEAQVMDFISVVPPHGSNLCVWSPRLATVLVEACCLIESIFHQFKDDAATVQDKGKPKNRLTLGPYAALYSSLLRLPERTVILLTDIPEYRTPFGLWKDLLGGAPFDEKTHVPEWWRLYNDSKHDRIKVFQEFTLTRAIEALAGALVVISTVPAFAFAMVQHEWLPVYRRPETDVRDYCQTLRGQRVTAKEWPFAIATQLLAIPIGHGRLPSDINDFRSMRYGENTRLLRHFRKD